MTTNHHTVIATGAAANASVFNAPMSQLDTAITTSATAIAANALLAAATTAEVVAARDAHASLDTRLDFMQTVQQLAGGNVATKANGVSAAGQKVLTVDATTGFIVGAYVTYLLNGTTLEGNTIGSIQAGVSLTLGTNIGATPAGGVLDDSYISMISISEYLAAQAIPHAGTLTLPQTMEYANAGAHNIEAYGASSAASLAVNTAAINAAIDAASVAGGIVDVPSKVYLCDEIVAKSNVVVRGLGAGAVLKVPDGEGELFGNLVKATSQTNFAFDNITFDGNSANQTAGGPSNGTILLALTSCSNVKITRCSFVDNLYVAIKIMDIGGDLSHDILIAENSFSNVDGGISDQSHGTHDVNIIGNRFSGGTSEGVSIYTLPGYLSRAVNIIGNIVNDKDGAGIQITNCQNFTVTGNVTYGCSMGIRLAYYETEADHPPNYDGVITGNSIYQPTTYGIDVFGVRCIVSNNSVYQPGAYGIVLQNTATDCLVANNIITDPNFVGTAQTADGIIITGATDCVVQGNLFVETRTPSKTRYIINIVDNSTTHSARNVIKGNHLCRSGTTNSIYIGANVIDTRVENNTSTESDNVGIINLGTRTSGFGNYDEYDYSATPASASELALAATGDLFHVTGTNAITSIAASATMKGRLVTLQFNDIVTFTDGGNLDINGNFVSKAGASITLYCDGTNWIEISRVTRP